MSATAQPATTSTVRRRVAGVAAAVAGSVAIWTIGLLGGVDYTVRDPDQPDVVVGVVPVAILSLVFALLGWAALALLERFAGRRATAIWIALAAAVAVLSMFPVVAADATVGAKVALGATHLAVAAAAIALFPRRG